MNKVVDAQTIKAVFKSGQTIMVGGFALRGVPDKLLDLVVESGIKDVTMISEDGGDPGLAPGKLVRSGQVSKMICSHVGKNPEVGRLIAEGKLNAELIPQGTLVERIRCGGAGIGGVLLRTGLGTVVEKGKQKVTVNGQEFLLELPLHADIALIHAKKADTMGNLVYHGASRNFNPVMATAADLVIVDADEIVPAGTLNLDEIVTPGVFVGMILENKEGNR
jgi:acetate CoA/acetoacetate CoA-transferase alpha subunit